MSKQINKIVVVGGGSAGWMTASTLISQFSDREIVVIESPNIPTVGVGESTIGGINNWLKLIGVTDRDFMSFTDASYKISIKFTDFYKRGSGSFHYPFGRPNTDGNTARKNDWYFKKFLYPETPISDYADSMYPSMALVNANKITKNEDNKLPGFDFETGTAYHFDATKFGIWLRDNFCKPKGVIHIQAEVKDIITNDDGIDYLQLDNGDVVKADLFIDCTGFKSILLAGAMKEPFVSYSHILPNNSAWATRVPYNDKRKELVPYTECTAINNGWVWNIPLWSRIGTGYVYSDKYIDDAGALEEFKEHLRSIGHYSDDLEFKNIKMRVGIHKRLWVKNVAAIGLSAGFIEPLESSGLFTVHEFLYKLVRTLGRDKDRYVSQFDKDAYSFSCNIQFKIFAEFVALHYALSHRDDTEYWKDVGRKQYSVPMVEQTHAPYIDAFASAAEQKFDHYFFNDDTSGFHCILTGLNYFPTDEYGLKIYSLHPNYKEEWDKCAQWLDIKKKSWEEAVEDAPTLYDFLEKNHYAST